MTLLRTLLELDRGIGVWPRQAMKGFVGVTDNDWFAWVTLLKQDWPKAQGLSLTAFRPDWAKANREFPISSELHTSSC